MPIQCVFAHFWSFLITRQDWGKIFNEEWFIYKGQKRELLAPDGMWFWLCSFVRLFCKVTKFMGKSATAYWCASGQCLCHCLLDSAVESQALGKSRQLRQFEMIFPPTFPGWPCWCRWEKNYRGQLVITCHYRWFGILCTFRYRGMAGTELNHFQSGGTGLIPDRPRDPMANEWEWCMQPSPPPSARKRLHCLTSWLWLAS